MGQGIQVFNDQGNIIFDTNTRTIKVLTVLPMTANTTSTFSHPLLGSAEDTPLYILTPPAQAGMIEYVSVTFNGTTATIVVGNIRSISWNSAPKKIMIGVY